MVLSPAVQVPVDLEKLFVVLAHELPTREQLEVIARGIATEDGEVTKRDSVADCFRYCRRADAVRSRGGVSFVAGATRHHRPEPLWELKAQRLTKSGLLQLHRGGHSFDNLGGLKALKAFCKRWLLHTGRLTSLKRLRGVLLLGVPGVGKSAFAKALGTETGRPTLVLDVGALFGSLVGQTEQNVWKALRIAKAMARCVLFIDEIKKGLIGVGGASDSGVSSRLFGTFLTWLNDHQSEVHVVATCYDISRLPPEFSRAERFEGIFFLDLPSPEEKAAIWSLYRDQYELDAEQAVPVDEHWTGAEIRACCRLAALLDVPLKDAVPQIVPIAVTAAESVERLRTCVSGRCLSAEVPRLYGRAAPAGETPRR